MSIEHVAHGSLAFRGADMEQLDLEGRGRDIGSLFDRSSSSSKDIGSLFDGVSSSSPTKFGSSARTRGSFSSPSSASTYAATATEAKTEAEAGEQVQGLEQEQ